MQHSEQEAKTTRKALTRRRFIALTAMASGMATLPALATPSPARWRGVALGAQASLTLYHTDPKTAREGIEAAIAEVRRLEKIFSLYRTDSALTRLNLEGTLAPPPLDLVRCLDDARRFSQLTGGAFDVTVQPLWTLYSQHFANTGADPSGPDDTAIAAARRLVDFEALQIATDRISLQNPNMAVTLNGIAQGYITDRVAELLRSRGFENVLVDLGETRALGTHADGTLWRIGIRSPLRRDELVARPVLRDQAVATSGGYGMWFDAARRHHHLFDPKTGRSAARWPSVTVFASDATTADALSTAFAAMPREAIERTVKRSEVRVMALDTQGRQILNLG